MNIDIRTKRYTFEEFCDKYNFDIIVQEYGEYSYRAYIENVKFRNMRGETIVSTGLSPINAVNNYIYRIAKHEIAVTNTSPHTRIMVPPLRPLKVTDLKTCEFCTVGGINILKAYISQSKSYGFGCECPHCGNRTVVPSDYKYPMRVSKEWVSKYGTPHWVDLPYINFIDGVMPRTATKLLQQHDVGLPFSQTVGEIPSHLQPKEPSFIKRLLGFK